LALDRARTSGEVVDLSDMWARFDSLGLSR